MNIPFKVTLLPNCGLLVLVLAMAAAAPFMLSDYRLFQVGLVLTTAVALLGVNLLTGFTGQISLGHGAFFALGAYAAAIGHTSLGLPHSISLLFAAAICFVFGWLFGRPALRLEGHALGLATFAMAIALPQLLKVDALRPWTGGAAGLAIARPAVPAWLAQAGLSEDRWVYAITALASVGMFTLAITLLRGRTLRALLAIREQPVAAEAMGIDLAATKTLVFGLSGLFTGVAGVLNGWLVQFAAPESYSFFLSISFLVGIVLGGLGSISGAVYGAVLLQAIPAIADTLGKSAPGAVFGVLIIVSAFLMPHGLADVAGRLWRKPKLTPGASAPAVQPSSQPH